MKNIIILAVLMTASISVSAVADVPGLINFQGILTDPAGVPLASDTNSVLFTIYDAAAGGSSKWSETQSVVTDGQGRFSILLGAVDAIEDTVFKNSNRWLGVKVGADAELVPRTQIVSVGYSQRVSTLDGSSGGTVSGEMVVEGSGAGDRIALGVGDPNIALELRSGTFGGDPYIDFSNDAVDDFDARIQLNGNKGLEITVDSAVIIPTGNVGIGTTTPQAQLEVLNDSASSSSQTGVNGIVSNASSGSAFGGIFTASSAGTGIKSGVRGNASSTSSNPAYGVYGAADNGSTGDAYGGYFTVPFSGGTGIEYGVYSQVATATGWGLYTPNNVHIGGNVGIGTTSPQGALDVSSTTGALIVPRMTTAQRDALAAVNGMIVYNTSTNQFNFYEAGAWATK